MCGGRVDRVHGKSLYLLSFAENLKPLKMKSIGGKMLHFTSSNLSPFAKGGHC